MNIFTSFFPLISRIATLKKQPTNSVFIGWISVLCENWKPEIYAKTFLAAVEFNQKNSGGGWTGAKMGNSYASKNKTTRKMCSTFSRYRWTVWLAQWYFVRLLSVMTPKVCKFYLHLKPRPANTFISPDLKRSSFRNNPRFCKRLRQTEPLDLINTRVRERDREKNTHIHRLFQHEIPEYQIWLVFI